jgi:hypothetical protein
MFRKSMIALAAIATVSAAALAPTAASAKGGKWGGGWHHHHHFKGYGFYGAPLLAAGVYQGCWVKRWVDTPYGPRLRRVYVCY